MEIYILLACLILPSVINYACLYLMIKFGIFTEFVKSLTEDKDIFGRTTYSPLWSFVTPIWCMYYSIIIVIFLLYRLVIKPICYPIYRAFVFVYHIIINPLEKSLFRFRLDNH